jgi:rod shape-determining protein MreD
VSAPSVGAHSWRDRGVYGAAATLALVVLIQATLLSRIHFIGAQPDLLLVLVVCWSLVNGVSEGLVLAFAGGLTIDLIAGLPLGTTPLALMPVCFLGVVGRSSVYVNNVWLPMLLVAIATPIEGLLTLLIRDLRGVPVDWQGATLRIILPALVLNVVMTPFVARLMRRFGPKAQVGAA